MAKQFGVSDQALAGLHDVEAFPFPPDQKAALRFADAMTREGGRVDDDLFDELRRHFDEPQIIEIASVVGTFNYFNRVNNALKMDVTLTDPEVVATRIAAALAPVSTGAEPDPAAACERAVELLYQGRRYGWIAIDGLETGRRVPLARHGEERPGRPDLTLPIHRGAETIGAIEITAARPGSLDEEDRALIERVAGLLAPIVGGRRPAP